MPIKKLSLLVFLCLMFINRVPAQPSWGRDIAKLHKKISDQLFANRTNKKLADDGIYFITIRISAARKADSIFYGHVAGASTEVPSLIKLNLAECKYTEQGIRYITIPLIVINSKNEEGEDETVLDIYNQSFRKFAGKRDGIIRYTKPLVFINSKPMQ